MAQTLQSWQYGVKLLWNARRVMREYSSGGAEGEETIAMAHGS
jgi:hypothetical protein